MRTRRRQAEDNVTRDDRRPVDDCRLLDDADGKAGQIVLAVGIHPGHFGRFAADQRAAGQFAASGDALDDIGGDVDVQPAAGKIVKKEQRRGPETQDVVDAHSDKVNVDGVVLLSRESLILCLANSPDNGSWSDLLLVEVTGFDEGFNESELVILIVDDELRVVSDMLDKRPEEEYTDRMERPYEREATRSVRTHIGRISTEFATDSLAHLFCCFVRKCHGKDAFWSNSAFLDESCYALSQCVCFSSSSSREYEERSSEMVDSELLGWVEHERNRKPIKSSGLYSKNIKNEMNKKNPM